jgi:predicted nucleic acid-binding Zn ribbon protein
MSFEEFLTFKKYIMRAFMTVIYIIGAFIITIGSLWAIAGGASVPSYYYGIGLSGVALGIFGLTVGNLGWRLLCELIVVTFSIHDRIVSIDNKLGSGGQSMPLRIEGSRTKFCANCGTEIPPGAKFCANCGKPIPE